MEEGGGRTRGEKEKRRGKEKKGERRALKRKGGRRKSPQYISVKGKLN